jgi:hypothetical protein
VRLARVCPALHVRHEFPLRAAYFRQVLPRVVGFPHRQVLCLIRHPRDRIAVSRPPGSWFSGRVLGSSLVPFPSFPVIASIAVYPQTVLSPRQEPPVGASRVLPRFSSCMPRPEDSGGPPHPHHSGCFVLTSGTLKPSPSATSLSRSCTSTSGCASPLRPTGCSVYASPVLFAAFRRLRHRRKTRYGWVASPYPTGTFTPQEAPSLSRRDNEQAKRRAGYGSAAASSPSAGADCSVIYHLPNDASSSFFRS